MMNSLRITARDVAEDLFFGQEVLVWARWFMIAALTVLALGTADSSAQLALAALPIAGLMAMNFYLHGRHAMGRPANRLLVKTAAVVDVSIITAIVLLWRHGTLAPGLESPLFVLYYPVLLAFAFVFPPRASALYTVLVLSLYAAACVEAPLLSSAPAITTPQELKTLALRLITLGAMGALGTLYWRIARQRSRALGESAAPASASVQPSEL
jgi:hypothetical protein